jgi:hypothetical protein
VNPLAATCKFAVYVPTARLLGFTRTINDVGSGPDSGDAESQSALLGLIVTEYGAVLDPPFTASVFADGNDVPTCHENASVAGVGVKVDCPRASTMHNNTSTVIRANTSHSSALKLMPETPEIPVERPAASIGICR